MNSAPRSRWDLLGSRRSLGLTAFLITAPIGFFASGTATREPFSSTQVFLSWCAIGVLSQLALGVVLLAGHRLVAAWDPAQASTRASVIGLTLLAAAARGAVIAVLPAMWDLSTTASPGVRILSSAIIFGLWLTIIGAALASNDQYRAVVNGLLDELVTRELAERLLDVTQGDDQAPQALKRIAESSSHVTRVLDESLGAVDHRRTARLVQEAVEERLRPLSHELWFSPAPQLDAPHRLREFLLRVLATPVPFVRALSLMTALLLLNSLVWHGWPLGLVGGLAAAATTALVVITLTVWGEGRRIGANALMYLLLLLLPTAMAVLALESVTPDMHREPVVLAMAIGIPAAIFLGAMGHTVIADRQATVTALRATIDDPTWDEHLGAMERRSAESAAATFLHNTVQSRLVAAALQLEHAASTHDIAAAEEAIAHAREAVALIGTEGQTREAADPRGRLVTLATAWKGIATIDLDIPDEIASSAAWQVAVDAVEEAVANSIRHGGASRITVTFHVGDDAIDVVVADDGSMGDDATSAGIGLAWLDAATGGDWSITPSDAGTTLRLRIRS